MINYEKKKKNTKVFKNISKFIKFEMLWHSEKSRSIFDYKKQTKVMWKIGEKHVKREGM